MAERPAIRPIGEKLARCNGYAVRGAGGETLGRVAWVRYATRADCPDTLVVRAGSLFAARNRLEDIATDRIKEVDTSSRTITLA